MAAHEIRRILVVKPSSLGDILHTFPAMELLRRHCPEAQVDWLVHPAFAEALDFSPFPVSEKILFRRKELGRVRSLPHEFCALVKKLREKRYDLVLDFQGLLRSSIFGFLAKGGLPVGFAQPRERLAGCLYGRRMPVDMNIHAVERNVALVNALFSADDPVPRVELPVSRFVPALPPVCDGRKLVGVIPGARWESKCFPAELFVSIMRQVHHALPDTVFVIIGAPSECVRADEIVGATGEWCVSMAGKTSIGEMVEVMRRCRIVLSNDSGPVHVAAALHKTVFGLFGPTRPELTGPYGERHRIYQRLLSCSKCLKRTCSARDLLACHRLNSGLIAADMIHELKQGDQQ